MTSAFLTSATHDLTDISAPFLPFAARRRPTRGLPARLRFLRIAIMPDSEEEAPLLGSEANLSPAQPSGRQATVSETTPLLAGASSDSAPLYNGPDRGDDAASSISQISSANDAHAHLQKTPSRRWPSIVAIFSLAIVAVSIIVLAYFVPAAVEEYAKQGTVVEPTNLSLESISADGIRARVQGIFRLDGSRIENVHVRRIGRAATSVVRKLGTEQTVLRVYLPDFESVLLGSVEVPPLVVSLVDGHTTTIDFVANLIPGDAEAMRQIANQWLEGRLNTVRLQGKADIELKTGFIPLGTHSVSEFLVLEGQYLYRSFAAVFFGELSHGG